MHALTHCKRPAPLTRWLPILLGVLSFAPECPLCLRSLAAQEATRGTVFRLRGEDPVAAPLPVSTLSTQRTSKKYSLKLTAIRAMDGSNSGAAGVGAAKTAFLRIAPATYPGDGSGTEILEPPARENPRTISNVIVDQGTTVIPSARGLTNHVWAWGQFIDHDLDLTGTNPANGEADITIDDPTDILGPNPIPFDRSNFLSGTGTPGNPRQHVNEITSFIDASNVYGSSNGRAQALRTLQGGQLKTSAGDLLPFNVDGIDNAGGPNPELFVAGDVRVNENVMLMALHTLFVREHNRLATMLALLDPDADDETLFQVTRKIIAAEIQIVTYKEWLPAVMGRSAPKPEQIKFNASTDPRVSTEFSTALFRVGHTLLSSNLPLAENGAPTGGLPLQAAFFNIGFLTNDPLNVDRLHEGFAREAAQEIDNLIVDDVRNFLFGPPGAGGLDLASLNIQRGRDHGLPDYNSVREAYGLKRVTNFSQITSSTAIQSALADLYGTVNNIDPWVGMLAEDHLPGSSVGPLIQRGLLDQFRRAAAGDKFFSWRDPDLQQPAVSAVIDLSTLTFSDIVRANTTVSDMPANAFLLGTPVNSDVVVTYHQKDNCLHITGNRRDNSVTVIANPLGFLITGSNGTRINDSSSAFIRTRSKPRLTVELDAGDDALTLVGGIYSDGLIVMGAGTNVWRNLLATFSQLSFDVAATP